MKKKIVKLLILTMMATMSSSFSQIKSEATIDENNVRATGLVEPTKEEKEWFNKNKKSYNKINLNELAISRIGQNSKAKTSVGQAVKIGNEFATEEVAPYALTSESPSVSSLDNSNLPSFPNINTQGSIGSCASYATTYYQMSHMLGLVNGYNNKVDNQATLMSPKLSYNLNNGGENAGSSVYGNIVTLKDVGAISMAEFPYVGDASNSKNYLEWPTSNTIWRNASKNQIDSFGSVVIGKDYSNKTPVTGPKDSDLDDIKKVLMNGYVLTFSTYIYNVNQKAISNNPNSSEDDKVVGEYAIYEHTTGGAHAMTVVGYNDDIWVDVNQNNVVDQGELGAFKIANSWGTSYDNKGFMWFTYDSFNQLSSIPGFTNNSNRTTAFWGNEAYFIIPKVVESPKLALEVTVETEARGDIGYQIVGAKNITTSKDVNYYEYGHISYKGGKLGFDGIGVSNQGSYTISLNPLLNQQDYIANKDILDKFYYQFNETTSNGKPAKILDVKLVNKNGDVVARPNNITFPLVVDGNSAAFEFDYKYVENGLKTPIITLDEMQTSEDGLYNINLDGSQPDGRYVDWELYENNVLIKTNLSPSKGTGLAPIFKDIDGSYTYKMVIKDRNGNTATSNLLTVKVDSLKKPTLTVNELVKYNDGIYDITANGNAYIGRKTTYELYENGKVIKTGDFTNAPITFNFKNTVDGTYTYKFVYTDASGNTESSDEIKVVVNTNNYANWDVGVNYKLGDKVVYKGIVYQCTYIHKSQADWTPDVAYALWKKI